MYVEDMVKGFVRMDALKKTSQGRFDERFQEVYGQDPPKANTYHDQVRKWNLAPSTTRNTALAAGRTRDGEWSRFARSSPLKKNL
jgi:chitodextrinase